MAELEYKVNPETYCWHWLLHKDRNGYGKKWTGGKKGSAKSAHRVYYETKYGNIPSGCVLDHLCKNPECVNPDHLEVVTQQINVQRGKSSKLDIEKVSTIKRFFKLGCTQAYLASIFGVGQHQISRIVNNKRWANQS